MSGKYNIGIISLGYVGLPLLIEFAFNGYEVFDVNFKEKSNEGDNFKPLYPDPKPNGHQKFLAFDLQDQKANKNTLFLI